MVRALAARLRGMIPVAREGNHEAGPEWSGIRRRIELVTMPVHGTEKRMTESG